MNILYYTWEEFCAEDGIASFRALGHVVEVISFEWRNIGYDEDFEQEVLRRLRREEKGKRYYDAVFSFNFFPVISAACQKASVPYISLIFDSPFLPLTSVQIDNPCNHVYTFDRKQAEQMRREGHLTVHYSPLGVAGERIRQLTEPLYTQPYEHEVCFLGTLYNDEFDFYDQISYLPPYLKGWFDGVLAAQENVFGFDLIGDETVISRGQISEMHEYVKFQRTAHFTMDENVVLRDMLRKKVTKTERPKLLGMLAKHFSVDLYTRPKQVVPPGVREFGYAEYMKQMPRIFNRSKINLNITLRTIISGIPLRVTDVLAAGGFLITTYQEEIAAQFKDGVELVIAYTPEDLVEKCAYYLTHDEEREAIAAAGRAKVLEEFDYATIFTRMIKESA
ncbi:MAG: glycosyltransferase [Lachnospiraceae bacterium]|nr:glycosyltransferase [Lachnospiraceae bacterium]